MDTIYYNGYESRYMIMRQVEHTLNLIQPRL